MTENSPEAQKEVHIFLNDLANRLKDLENQQNKIVEQSSSFIKKSLDDLTIPVNRKISNSSIGILPPTENVRTSSTSAVSSFIQTLSKFELVQTKPDVFAFKNLRHLEKKNKMLHNKVIKLRETFKDNFQEDNVSCISLYENMDFTLKRVESLQDAILIVQSALSKSSHELRGQTEVIIIEKEDLLE